MAGHHLAGRGAGTRHRPDGGARPSGDAAGPSLRRGAGLRRDGGSTGPGGRDRRSRPTAAATTADEHPGRRGPVQRRDGADPVRRGAGRSGDRRVRAAERRWPVPALRSGRDRFRLRASMADTAVAEPSPRADERSGGQPADAVRRIRGGRRAARQRCARRTRLRVVVASRGGSSRRRYPHPGRRPVAGGGAPRDRRCLRLCGAGNCARWP